MLSRIADQIGPNEKKIKKIQVSVRAPIIMNGEYVLVGKWWN